MNKRKYLVYKITNRFNNKIYIGVHSTLNESDRYMGSGVEIREALKKEGRKSFVKEILFIFDTKEEMLNKEKELVTKEFCMDENTYNRIEGGGVYVTVDMITVKDKTGNTLKVYRNDPRYISGELVGHTKGTITVKDKDGKCFLSNKNDPKYLSGELIHNMKGLFHAKDKEGNIFTIEKNDSRYLSGELMGIHKGKPQHPNFTQLGKNHSEESKQKIGLANSAKQKGECNSQFGTCWITKEGINKKIKNTQLSNYITQGWTKGRKI